MLDRDVEVPVVAVSPPARVRFFILGWLRRVRGVCYPRCHPLTSRCIWQVSDPRERRLQSSGPRALQELSVCWPTSLLFLPQQHWCRPESHTTHNAAVLCCTTLALKISFYWNHNIILQSLIWVRVRVRVTNPKSLISKFLIFTALISEKISLHVWRVSKASYIQHI